MHRPKLLVILLVCFVFVSVSVWAQEVTIPNGTELKVRTDVAINATASSAGKTYTGKVSDAVTDTSGKVIIPQNSVAYLKVVREGTNKVALDLTQVSVGGQRYNIESKTYKQGGLGKTKRTAKYAGGGALAGAVIGGLMGGGKGAAIGGLVGGAAGAGAQVMTSGKELKIPAETVLTYKLAQDLTMTRAAARTRTKAPAAKTQ